MTQVLGPKNVHEFVGDLKKWDRWMPWKEEDPSIAVTLGKKTSGAGASQTWTSDSGDGEITLLSSDRDTGIKFDMVWIQEDERMPATAGITYEEAGKKTRVTWSMKGDMTIPILGGWLALTMDSQIGRSFDRGLANLKKVVEGD